MLSAFGASIFWVWPLVMTNCLVATYSLPRLSQSALFVITASTLTRSQVGLSRIKVAVVLEPEEQAVNTSAAESQAGYKFTVLPLSQSQRRLESPPSLCKRNPGRRGMFLTV